ncbi:hypothetical protein JCM11641_006512 [Rhodosporidiobolus odoratus]
MPHLLIASVSVAWFAAAVAHAASWDCTARIGKTAFDLKKLDGLHEWESQTDTPPTITKTRYQLSLCSSLPDPTQGEDDCPSGSRLCMRTYSSRSGLEDRLLSVVPVAGEIGAGDFEPKASEADGYKVDERWTLEIGGGKYNGVEQRARIEMRCDAKATESSPVVRDYDGKAGILELEWTTAAACPASTDDKPPTPSPIPPARDDGDERHAEPSSSGIGFFGWFFTLLILGFIAYFALGIWNNYNTYGATGFDAIPHRELWRDLPYVVADLFKGRGGGRDGYSSLG